MIYAQLVYLSQVKLTDKANEICQISIPLTGKTNRQS
jgi:hypothetical protein